MDPFTIATGIAGFLSLTFEIATVLKEYISGVKSATSDAGNLLTEIEALNHVLEQLVTFLRSEDAKGNTFNQTSVLCSVIAVCHGRVEYLYRKLEKLFCEDKRIRVMKRIKWPLDKQECQQTVEILHRCTQTFEFSLSISNSALLSKSLSGLEEEYRKLQQNMEYVSHLIGQVPDKLSQLSDDISNVLSFASTIGEQTESIFLGVQDLQRKSKDDETEQLLRWLSPLEPQKRHQDIRQKRLQNTGEWLLEMAEFQAWRDSDQQDHNSILACYGIPGAGKTVISSLVVDHLSALFAGTPVGVACLYCDYRDMKAQAPANMLGGLLKQLILEIAELEMPKKIIETYQQNKRKNLELSVACEMLVMALQSFRSVYLCIDALDECDGDHRKALLESLRRVMQDSTRLFLTGRPNIEGDVNNCLQTKSPVAVQIIANQHDIEKYVNYCIDEDNNPDIMNDSLREEIVTTISAASQQMFLLPALQIQAVLEQLTITKRRNTLREMPKGLRDAFGDTIERIQRQRGAAELAMGVLKWTYLTRRPLRLEELRHALAVNPTDTRLDRDNFVSEKSLLSCCLGLIVIHEGTSTVRLVHLLLQEYLISQHQRLFKTGHSEIAQTCLTYMNFDNFSAEHTEIEKWLGYFTFFRYAACNWGHHVREQEDQPVEELALCLLQQPTTLKNISQVLGRSMRSYAEIHSVLFSALHVVAYFGASNVVRLLIDQARTESKDTQLQTLNSQDQRGRTPLLWAAAYGHEAVVRQFLELDDIDVNSKDHDEETPLSLAVKNKKDAVVRLLLERTDVDVNIRDHSGDTPLWCAFKTGHEAVVRILLERDDVDVNAKYRDQHTPLLLAAKNKKDAVVRLLLKRADVDVNIRDRSGETPLLHAAERGYEAIVRILLERADIDVNSKYQGSDTPLCCASKNCHKTVVELLLERDDVDVNEKDWQGWIPLSHAIENGNETIVRLILQRTDVDVHTTIPWGHPPLSHASGLSRQLIAQPPCRDEIEVSVRGQTPLSHAAEKGDKAVIMLLQQQKDINVNVQDEHGNTPLLCAARDGKDEVVQLLLARDDIDVSIKGWMGKTAISYAAENGNEGVVRLLLERDDIDEDDKESARETLESYTAMIHLLLELEIVEANAKKDCINPLWRTTESSNGAALQQMMERALMATYHYPTNPELET